MMPRRWSVGVVRILAPVCGIIFGIMPGECCLAAEQPPPIKTVLWVGGFAHDFDAYAKILSQELPKQAPTEIEVVRDAAFLERPDAKRPAVILMDHCYQSAKGVLTDGQKAKLLAWVRGGVGVVAVHASYYSFPEWKEVRELYGPTFIKHGKVDQYIDGRFVDRSHPITKDLPQTFRLRTELYQSTPLPADCHLLAVAKDESTSKEHPSIWAKKYGKGRVVAILPAHWPDAYQVKEFRQLIANSVLWTAGRLEK
jgi:type 1 glutamine amidotransferase